MGIQGTYQPSQQCQITCRRGGSGLVWENFLVDGQPVQGLIKAEVLMQNDDVAGLYTKSWGKVILHLGCDRFGVEQHVQSQSLPGVFEYPVNGLTIHGQLIETTPLECTNQMRVAIEQSIYSWAVDTLEDGASVMRWGVGPRNWVLKVTQHEHPSDELTLASYGAYPGAYENYMASHPEAGDEDDSWDWSDDDEAMTLTPEQADAVRTLVASFSTTGTCKHCHYWDKNGVDQETRGKGFGLCSLTCSYGPDAVFYAIDDEVLTPVTTHADFGCNQFTL